MKMMRFEPEAGAVLAIAPKAIGGLFSRLDEPSVEVVGDCAVVTIRGPLRHHAGRWCDSYEAIRERFDQAIASDAKRVALKIDSPGGYVSGCFELADYMRDKAAERGKPLVAYVDGGTFSAAYAIACAAERIVVPPAGELGSIGVIAVVQDWTEAMKQDGLKANVFVSGRRKADSHPMVPVDAEAAAAIQATVDGFAKLFFEHVAKSRGMSVAQVKAFEAGTFIGASAVDAGLADEVGTFESMTVPAGSAGKKPGAVASTTTERSTMDKAILMALVGAGVLANAENATDTEVFAGVTKVVTERGEMLSALGVKSAEEAKGTIEAFKVNSAKLDELKAKAQELETKMAAQERASLMAEHANKFPPAMQDWAAAQSLDTLRGYVASASPIVKADDELPAQAAKGAALTAEDRKIAEAMGVDEAEFAAQKAALDGGVR